MKCQNSPAGGVRSGPGPTSGITERPGRQEDAAERKKARRKLGLVSVAAFMVLMFAGDLVLGNGPFAAYAWPIIAGLIVGVTVRALDCVHRHRTSRR